MGATPFRAQGDPGPNRDSLRSIRAGAVGTALPLRNGNLLLRLDRSRRCASWSRSTATTDEGAARDTRGRAVRDDDNDRVGSGTLWHHHRVGQPAQDGRVSLRVGRADQRADGLDRVEGVAAIAPARARGPRRRRARCGWRESPMRSWADVRISARCANVSRTSATLDPRDRMRCCRLLQPTADDAGAVRHVSARLTERDPSSTCRASGWRSGPSSRASRARSPATSWRNRRASGPRHSSGGSAMRWTASRMQDVEDRDRDAARSAVRNAVRNARHAGRVTMSATGNRAAGGPAAKPYTLRSLRADAIWTALPGSTALTPQYRRATPLAVGSTSCAGDRHVGPNTTLRPTAVFLEPSRTRSRTQLTLTQTSAIRTVGAEIDQLVRRRTWRCAARVAASSERARPGGP